MSEEVNALPETAEGGSIMQAGLHLVKIHSIEVAKDDKGIAKHDKNGNPGLKITFVNRAEDSISQLYYYSPLPINHPNRQDDNKRCKSEFKLTQLKKAFGFGTKSIPLAEMKSKKCWMAIRRTEFIDTQGNPIQKDGKQKQFHSIAEVWPLKEATAADPSRGRPILKGDPETDPANFLKGFFYELKVDVAPMQTTIPADEFDTPGNAAPQETQVAMEEINQATNSGPEGDW